MYGILIGVGIFGTLCLIYQTLCSSRVERQEDLQYRQYTAHPEAVIVSCFFNPQNSPYRLIAFQKFYHSIKHLNHRIIECVIGDSKPQLPESPYITRVHSDSLLWHKESLLNKVISELPKQFKYVFWIDADVKFSNPDWMISSVVELENNCKILQPFEYCIHLDRNQTEPDFETEKYHSLVNDPKYRHKKMWRSFCANYVTTNLSGHKNYDIHGHVGFAWGARRDVLEQVPLYDRALIGGADHIISHAAAGQIPHECIIKGFKDNIDEVETWMNDFHAVVGGQIGYVQGELYHYWHGDIEKRQYLQRIKDFTLKSKEIDKRDENGLFIRPGDRYLKDYFQYREVGSDDIGFEGFDDGFYEDMGYILADFLSSCSPPPSVLIENADEYRGFGLEGTPFDSVVDYPDNEPEPIEELRGAGSAEFENYPDNEPDNEYSENFS